MGNGIIINVDRSTKEVENADYETMREAIGGGWLQAITLADGSVLYMDEEGKLKGFPVNPLATKLSTGILFEFDYIGGPAVLVGSVNSEGYHDDLTPQQRQNFMRIAS